MGEILLANSLVEIEILGKGLASPLSEDVGHGDFKGTAGAINVKRCIEDLIGTLVGERVMNEDIGLQLADALFESQEAAGDILPLQIIETIGRYEPRVRQVTAQSQPFNDPVQGVKIHISWVLRSTGRRENLVYPFYLNPAEGGLTNV